MPGEAMRGLAALHELAPVAGLVGAGVCLAERLCGPERACGPGRDWGPAAVVLAVMALMAGGVGGAAQVAGAGAVAGAGVWTALGGSLRGSVGGARRGGRAAAVVDLATMAVLAAGAAEVGEAGSTAGPGHPSGMGTAGMRTAGGLGAYDVRFFLFLVTCWLLARAAVRLTGLVGSTAPVAVPEPVAASARGRAVLREAGSAAMVVAMAAMSA